MSEAYQHTEYELRNDIDNISCISYTFERYVEEVNNFIDRLLEDTKEINILRKEKEKLNKSLEEQRHFYLGQLQQKENIIKEVREYITSYESIETIQQFDHNKNNKDLDYSTIDEMTRRYMIVHDKILKILDKEVN